jgi:hypothetical protein
VRQADCIHLLEDGRTVEGGTHDELVARGEGVCGAVEVKDRELFNLRPCAGHPSSYKARLQLRSIFVETD